MTDEKIREVLKRYREVLEKHQAKNAEVSHQLLLTPLMGKAILNHCASMLDKMEEFLKEGRRDKVFRWLGFMQGALWSQGIYTLEDLMNHNRPDKRYFSFEEVMRELELGEEELLRMVEEGELRAFRDENKMKFLNEDVEITQKARTNEPKIILPDQPKNPEPGG